MSFPLTHRVPNFGSLSGQRILVVSRVFVSRHGGSIYCQEFVRALLTYGSSVIVVTEDPGELGEFGVAKGLSVVVLPAFFRREWRSQWKRLLDTVRLWRLAASRATMVIVQGDLPRLTYVLLQHLVPLVFIRQDGILSCPANDRFLPRSRKICTKPLGISCLAVDRREGCFGAMPLPQRIGRVLFRMRDRFLLGLVKNFVANSSYIAALHRRPAHVLYPPLLQGGENQPEAPRRLKDLAFCGRLEAVKGGSEAVRILAALPEDYRLHVLGDGPQRELLERLALETGVSGRIQFRGWTDAAQRDKCFASVGCVLLPSLWSEAFAMVGLEALARGTPVVAYEAGGISEWCRSEVGRLVPIGDIAKAAAAIQDLTTNEGVWRAASLAARQMTRRKFRAERFENEISDYLGVLCRPNPEAR